MKGGKIVVRDGKIIESLPLPIANLMTDDDPMKVIESMEKMKRATGITNDGIDPFMTLSFTSLAVTIRISIVFDVKNWCFKK